MRSSLEAFAGLLDRSVEQIAALAADARTFDISRIGRIADIWDNNTFPLISAACAPRLLQVSWARAGLLWMADLGAARRALLVGLDAALDTELPTAAPEWSAHRDYAARVFPGSFPVTAEIIDSLAADYDLAGASVRFLTAQTTETGLQVNLELAAERRFVPSSGRVAPDGSREPWPPALLNFTFVDVTDLRFDAQDRTGATITRTETGSTVAIGHSGGLRATSASVWPNDPVWYESAAGRAADAVTPHKDPVQRRPTSIALLTEPQRAAALALAHLMIQIRVVYYHPTLAACIPVREICDAAAGAGGAILAAAALHGPARRKAFAQLAERWRRIPPEVAPAPIPSGPAILRYASFDEPHEEYDIHREGSAVLVAAVPDADPASPWCLASEEVVGPTGFRITSTVFDGVQHVQRDTGSLTIGEGLAVRPQ